MLTAKQGDHPLASGHDFSHGWEVKLCSLPAPERAAGSLCPKSYISLLKYHIS